MVSKGDLRPLECWIGNVTRNRRLVPNSNISLSGFMYARPMGFLPPPPPSSVVEVIKKRQEKRKTEKKEKLQAEQQKEKHMEEETGIAEWSKLIEGLSSATKESAGFKKLMTTLNDNERTNFGDMQRQIEILNDKLTILAKQLEIERLERSKSTT
jgi:hypothetical protein